MSHLGRQVGVKAIAGLSRSFPKVTKSVAPRDEEGKEKMGLEMLPIFPLGEACLKIG